MNLWNALLIQPLTSSLLFLYGRVFRENLGLAIIAFTILLRVILFPLSLPALRSAKVQKEIKPKLDKLKKKYKDDRQKLAQAQMELFRQAGVNPFAGCLPQILQIFVLIALFQVLRGMLEKGGLNTQFLIWDLSQPDRYYVLPLLAAATQFFLSRMMLPAVAEEKKAVEATKGQADDFATVMQKQNLYLFPLLTLILGRTFSSGLMLYWLFASLLQLGQQWWVSSADRHQA